MNTAEHIALDAAVTKALAGEALTEAERLDAAARFATNLVTLCFALRDAAGGPPVVADRLREPLARRLTLASTLIDSVGTAVLNTRASAFRSGGRAAESAHQMAKQLGWACRTATPADRWPDRDELLAEIALERSLAGRAVEPSSSPTPKAASNRGKGINGKMLDRISKDTASGTQECFGWTSDRWAKELDCSAPSVVATKAWKQLKMFRLGEEASRVNDRRRNPRGKRRPR